MAGQSKGICFVIAPALRLETGHTDRQPEPLTHH